MSGAPLARINNSPCAFLADDGKKSDSDHKAQSSNGSGGPGGPSADDSEESAPEPQCVSITFNPNGNMIEQIDSFFSGFDDGGVPGTYVSGGLTLDGVDITALQADSDPTGGTFMGGYSNDANFSVTCPAGPGCGETALTVNGQWVMANYDCAGSQCGYLTPSDEYRLNNGGGSQQPVSWLAFSNPDSPNNAIDGSQFDAVQNLQVMAGNMAQQAGASSARKPPSTYLQLAPGSPPSGPQTSQPLVPQAVALLAGGVPF
jgi:hypothetical protein